MKSVYSAVRTGALNTAVCASSVKGSSCNTQLQRNKIKGKLVPVRSVRTYGGEEVQLHCVDTSGYLQVQEEGTAVPTKQKFCGWQSQCGRFGKQKSLSPLSGIELIIM